MKPTAWVLSLVLLSCGFGSPSRAAPPPPLFGTVEFRAESLAALPQWRRALDRIEEERPVYRACNAEAAACPSRGVMAWRAMMRGQDGRRAYDQLRAVNHFVNNWRYKSDEHNYGRRDHWASPLEFLRRSGDCEDYVITKYVTLRELGYEPGQLRVVVVHDVLRDVAHAVLAVYLADGVYILDNLTDAVLPQHRVTQYVPYYSTNERARWAHVAPLAPMVASHGSRTQPGGRVVASEN